MKYFILTLLIIVPFNSYAGLGGLTDETDTSGHSITGYYDLTDRNSYFQITNVTENPITIHIQIFQNDRDCSELNFFDDLTANDTVIYDLDNLVKNNGSTVPINLLENSDGYVVVTLDEGNDSYNSLSTPPLIGNFRIVDNSGYEYRTNMRNLSGNSGNRFAIANFNTVNNAQYADLVLYVPVRTALGGNTFSSTLSNRDDGVNFDIFVYDMDEEPLSCDTKNFACGNVMNYGINEDYRSSKGDNLVCEGGGLANLQGGYVLLDNLIFPNSNTVANGDALLVNGFIGLNNNNGTGSMDSIINIDRLVPPPPP